MPAVLAVGLANGSVPLPLFASTLVDQNSGGSSSAASATVSAAARMRPSCNRRTSAATRISALAPAQARIAGTSHG